MTYIIRLKEKSDLEWLQSVLDNSVAKLEAGSELLLAASEHIARVHQAVHDVEEVRTRKPKESTDDYVPNLCIEHPKYEAKRVPARDCDGCWDAYKAYHPEKYDTARRNFERKLNA